MTPLTNKTALVTGASRGIGLGIALALGREGATIIGTATTEAGAQQITHTFQEHGIAGRGEVLEVTSPASIEELMAKVKKQNEVFDILVNNAAITRDNLFIRMKEDEWFDVINTNLNAVYRLTKACIRNMLKTQFGRIICVGSVVAFTGNPGQANYSAAKAGLSGLIRSLAQEVSSRDITVNMIAPGFIQTDMTKQLSEEQRQAILQRIPMRRIGSVADIAHAAVFLASPSASYITGQVLHINGGMYMS